MKERIRRSSTRNEASLVSFESTTSKLPLLSLGTKYFRQVLQENAVCLCDDRTRVRCSKIKEKTEKKKKEMKTDELCVTYTALQCKRLVGTFFFFIYIFTERKFGGDKVIK